MFDLCNLPLKPKLTFSVTFNTKIDQGSVFIIKFSSQSFISEASKKEFGFLNKVLTKLANTACQTRLFVSPSLAKNNNIMANLGLKQCLASIALLARFAKA